MISAVMRKMRGDYNELNKIEREKLARASFLRVEKARLWASKGQNRRHLHDGLIQKKQRGNNYDRQRSTVVWLCDRLRAIVNWILVSIIARIFTKFFKLKIEKASRQCPQTNRIDERIHGHTHFNFFNDNHDNDLNGDELWSHISFVAIDCEMCGVGKGGLESVLARCSVVSFAADNNREGIKILFDKFVKPTKAVTDFRTEFSGITAEMLNRKDGSVISFEECRNTILHMLSSSPDGGRVVVVVGHGLENDFDVLKIKHPRILTRDTSLYPPFMQAVRSRRYRRKLSALAEEHLGYQIQQQTQSPLSSFILNQSADNHCGTFKEMSLGHSSVEDSAAALLLYAKFSYEWEKSLNFPLRRYYYPNCLITSNRGEKNITIYVDGCNVPIGLRRRRVYDNTLPTDSFSSTHSEYSDSSSIYSNYQLVSTINTRTYTNSSHSVSTCLIDWAPIVRSVVLNPSSFISKLIFMYDGAAFQSFKEGDRPKTGSHLVYPLTSSTSNNGDTTYEDGGLYIHITDHNTAVDDVIVECCKKDIMKLCPEETDRNAALNLVRDSTQQSTLPEVSNYFEHVRPWNDKQNKRVQPDRYAIIRRTGLGGTKTNKHLFDKLHLRRPQEGALCLLPSLWPCFPQQNKEEETTKNSNSCISLEEDGLSTIQELQNVSKVHHLLEFQFRPVHLLRSIVVTDDVLLADRVVKEGGAVLSYRQFEQALLW